MINKGGMILGFVVNCNIFFGNSNVSIKFNKIYKFYGQMIKNLPFWAI